MKHSFWMLWILTKKIPQNYFECSKQSFDFQIEFVI